MLTRVYCFMPFPLCVSVLDDGTERVCDTLLMCIVTVLNQGLRNGGGVGDILRRPSKEVRQGCVYLLLSCFLLDVCL